MQTPLQSLLEAWTNILVGYSISVFTQIVVFPWFGLKTTLGQNLKIGLIFTVVALGRSYLLRRLFNRWHR